MAARRRPYDIRGTDGFRTRALWRDKPAGTASPPRSHTGLGQGRFPAARAAQLLVGRLAEAGGLEPQALPGPRSVAASARGRPADPPPRAEDGGIEPLTPREVSRFSRPLPPIAASVFLVERQLRRGKRIRTSDLSVPNRAHYQAVLCPENFHFVVRAGIEPATRGPSTRRSTY